MPPTLPGGMLPARLPRAHPHQPEDPRRSVPDREPINQQAHAVSSEINRNDPRRGRVVRYTNPIGSIVAPFSVIVTPTLTQPRENFQVKLCSLNDKIFISTHQVLYRI